MPLRKHYHEHIIDGGAPADAGQAPGEYWCLPPPPPGYQYRPNPSPNGWSPLEPIPKGCSSGTYLYKPPTGFAGGSFSLPSGCHAVGPPVFDDDGNFQGVYISCPCRTPPLNTGIPSGVARVLFDAPTAANGYPLGADTFIGHTVIAGVTVESTWHRRPGDGALVFGSARRLGNGMSVSSAAGGVMLVIKTAGRPARPARPPRVEKNYYYGWNAGANSKKRLDGDVEAVWRVEAFGAAVGFAADGTQVNGDYKQLSHAWYVDRDARGYARATPVEFGRLAGPARKINDRTELGLRRVSGVVTYLLDGHDAHMSTVPSVGRLQLSATLYRGTDKVI